MKNYQYILLDWDGNIAKTLDIWLHSFKTVLNERGHYPTDEEIAGSFGKFIDYFEARGVEDAEELYFQADVIAKKLLPNVELYPDALEVLKYFKDIGKKTALISTSSHANIGHLLDHYNIRQLFDIVIAGDDVENHKPHPESLYKALKKLDGNPEQAIMIGDSDKDLGAAQNAGIDSILFYPSGHTKFYDLEKLKTHNPTYVVDDFRNITDIVK